MKVILTLVYASLFIAALAQTPEVKEIKRFMSLGEKPGYKLILPGQQVDKFEKPYAQLLKTFNADNIKAPKGSNEKLYKKLFLKGSEAPILLIASMEQEGKNLGWTGYFFNEKDSTVLDNKAGIELFLKSVYYASMYSLYDDSIFIQNKLIKDAKSTQGSLSKNAEKNHKLINKSKDIIRNAEASIEASKALIASNQTAITGLQAAATETKSKLTDAENEVKKVEDASNEIKDILGRQKKLTKNLSELKKDPANNANLIIAQEADIVRINEDIAKKQEAFKSLEAQTKAMKKSAEKDADNAADKLKSAEKIIKKENATIENCTNKITDARKVIADNEAEVEKYQSNEKSKAEDEVKKLEARLSELITTQKSFQ